MNLLDIKAGEPIEIGVQRAYRFWRYKFTPGIKLYSWCWNIEWSPGIPLEALQPDFGVRGIYGFKTMKDLMNYINGPPEGLLTRCRISEADGVVFGVVNLWGVVWEHELGYRGQFGQPASFDFAYGGLTEDALNRLRKIFALETH